MVVDKIYISNPWKCVVRVLKCRQYRVKHILFTFCIFCYLCVLMVLFNAQVWHSHISDRFPPISWQCDNSLDESCGHHKPSFLQNFNFFSPFCLFNNGWKTASARNCFPQTMIYPVCNGLLAIKGLGMMSLYVMWLY